VLLGSRQNGSSDQPAVRCHQEENEPAAVGSGQITDEDIPF